MERLSSFSMPTLQNHPNLPIGSFYPISPTIVQNRLRSVQCLTDIVVPPLCTCCLKTFCILMSPSSVLVINTCEPLENPQNGKYLPSEPSPVDTELATICDPGYHPTSTDPVFCVNTNNGNNTEWEETPPLCGKCI